ncbi:MAG TPA: DUF3142 domain-containing protein [Pyrinomonadaceae bacterium]
MIKIAASRKRVTLALLGTALLLAPLALVFTRAHTGVKARGNAPSVVRGNQMPGLILWAWERPSDLSFIDPNEVGVAFLARTIHLRGDRVIARPRLQPLNVPQGTVLTAVARIETDRLAPPTLSKSQREELVSNLSAMAALPGIASIQIDFDARQSERAFYRQLIADVRRNLPPNLALSITALSSWCTGDDWLTDLPIEDAVPMLFRMGPDRQQVLSRLETGQDFATSLCRNSYGIATDEPVEHLDPTKRLYVFNPNAWTRESLAGFREKVTNAY